MTCCWRTDSPGSLSANFCLDTCFAGTCSSPCQVLAQVPVKYLSSTFHSLLSDKSFTPFHICPRCRQWSLHRSWFPSHVYSLTHSEEVHCLFPSSQFKLLLLLSVARVFGEGAWLWSESMFNVHKAEWLLKLSLSGDRVVLYPFFRAMSMSTKWVILTSGFLFPRIRLIRSFFFNLKQYFRPASAAMICTSTNLKAFTSVPFKLVIFVGAKRTELILQEDHHPPTTDTQDHQPSDCCV